MMNSERFLQAYILSSNFLKTSFSKNFFIALHPNDGVTKLFTPTVGKTSFGDTFTVNVADVNEINDYNNQLSRELSAIRAANPPSDNIALQEEKNKEWLLAQLHGLDLDSLNLIRENLSKLSAEEFSPLIRFINKCLNIRHIRRILFIQDEAQCLCRLEFGKYTGSRENKPWHLLQAYTYHMIRFNFEVTHIISGTTMHMSGGLSLVTSEIFSRDDPATEWFDEITDTMVFYLRNTASTLAIGGVNPMDAIVDVLCCRIINIQNRLIRDPYNPKDTYVEHILKRLGSSQSFGSELDGAFASAIIEKHGCNELKKWTDKHFEFPEWITPGMQFVTETNLSKAVSLYDYVNDIYKSTKYHNHAIQPPQHAGSDLVLSLVDKSNEPNEPKNVAIYEKVVPASKEEKKKEEKGKGKEKKRKKRPNYKKESGPHSKKMNEEEECPDMRSLLIMLKLDHDQYDGEVEIGLTKKFQKLQEQP
ncbi:118_t:CDS:2 [Rhizophagus irregularis]|nr:118_t:CDS:2 [Rhizophagus irregularis]